MDSKEKTGNLPKINNLAMQGMTYCCGMYELGNFNYVDPPGGKKMTHYHKSGGGWASQPNAAPTTKEDILKRMQGHEAFGIMCSTGAGQEYLEPILEEIGFQRVFTFRNPAHAQTPINVWVYSKNKL